MSATKTVGLEYKKWRIREWFPDISDNVATAMRQYHIELLRFNQRVNLVSRRTEVEADLTHFADSIMGIKLLFEANPAQVIHDIGSGNGFPGLIGAILDPAREFILIDKDARKVEFIKHVAGLVGAKNVRAIHTRIEDLQDDSVVCAVSRGFASIAKALLVTRHACMRGSEYYHFKSDAWIHEVAQIPAQLCSIWSPRLVKEYTLPDKTTRMALVLTKKIGE